MTTFNSIQDVFADQLGDLRSAENQLLDALPKMAQAAFDSELSDAFRTHHDQTVEHANRIQQIISSLHFDVPNEECEAMKGLIAEGEKVIEADGDEKVRDVALIAAAQRVEHYEIAAYGTARALADQFGLDDAKASPRRDARRGSTRRQATHQDRHRRTDRHRRQQGRRTLSRKNSGRLSSHPADKERQHRRDRR